MDKIANRKVTSASKTALSTVGSARMMALKYPWFDSAVLASSDGDMDAIPPHIALRKRLYPSFVTLRASASGESSMTTADIIDNFMDKGEYKVKVTADTPEFIPENAPDGIREDVRHRIRKHYSDDIFDSFTNDISENTRDGIPEDDDLITEELAEIYLNQGLFRQAKSIYERLCLLYPKKSVYFAEIIEKADRGRSAAVNDK